MALDGDSLYICDTENHAIRRADLKQRKLETIVGTGVQAPGKPAEVLAGMLRLNSPWDAVLHDGKLYVAMAGPHQIRS
jgi:hypothetical protein